MEEVTLDRSAWLTQLARHQQYACAAEIQYRVIFRDNNVCSLFLWRFYTHSTGSSQLEDYNSQRRTKSRGPSSGWCCNGGVGGTLNDFASTTNIAHFRFIAAFVNREHGGSHPRDKQAPRCFQHGGSGCHTAPADSSSGDSGKMLCRCAGCHAIQIASLPRKCMHRCSWRYGKTESMLTYNELTRHVSLGRPMKLG